MDKQVDWNKKLKLKLKIQSTYIISPLNLFKTFPFGFLLKN